MKAQGVGLDAVVLPVLQFLQPPPDQLAVFLESRGHLEISQKITSRK
jgi:hypothetical protein